MNKDLEAILLTENINRLEKVNEYLEIDYKQTLREMFTLLLEAIKTKALTDVYTMLSNIETIILSQDIKNYNTINNAVREASYKMRELKTYIGENEYRNIRFGIVDINRKLLERKEKSDNYSLYNFYHYLFFEEKNLDMVELILNSEQNILSKKDEFDNDLLYNVVDYFCSLNDEEDIKYFYEVILLILKHEEENLVKEDKEKYIKLLDRKFCKSKEHVREIKERINNFNKIDINALEKKYHVYSKIHDSVIKELKDFKLDISGRKFIDSNFITIDEEGALCLDDAVSIKKMPDGSYEYYIAITDVPSFVPYGSLNFYDAMKKIETLYLCDKTISMLPTEICNNFCSLLPNQNRNVIVYKVIVDPDYNVDYDSLEIIKGIINVRSKLTYKQVNKQRDIDIDTMRMLDDLSLVSFRLKSQNKAKEKYRKIENLINSSATYHHSMFSSKSISANIVQESMLLVNYLSAKYFKEHDLVYIFRNMQEYNEAFVNSEIDRLINLSHAVVNSADYKKLLTALKDNFLTASYSTVNQGHKGLNYKYYSHITSSARRFVDGFNQYLTNEEIFSTFTDSRYYELEALTKEIVDHINRKKKENSKFESEYNYLYSKKLIKER